MGQHSCCNKQKVKRGLWSPEEDEKLINYISTYGHGCWSTVPRRAGLQRCGKSCRLRWINYLRPDLKRGSFSPQEAGLIIDLHKLLGNKWAQIAKHLPGRTDNEVKNFWNSSIKKKLVAHGIPEIPIFPHLSSNNYNEVPNFHHQPSAFMNNPLPQQNPNFAVPNNPNPSFFHGVDQFFPQPHHEFNNFPDQGTVFNQSWPNFQPQNNLFQASNGQIQPQQVVIGGGDGGDQMVVAGAIVANDGGDPLLPPLEPAGNSQEVDPMEQLSSLLMSADSLRSGDALSAPADWFSESIESLMSMVTATSSSTSSSTSCSQMAKNPNQAPAPGSWAP